MIESLEPDAERIDRDDTEAVDCADCGTTGYRPAGLGRITKCRECLIEELAPALEADADTWLTRGDALERLAHGGMLPVRDPEANGCLVLSVEVDRQPTEHIKSIKHVVHRDCPRCDYDRATRHYQAFYTAESATTWRCRACGYLIDEETTL